MLKVVVTIKPSSATGASGLTRYIAESKRNPEKEGLGENEPRPLFSATEDKLTYLEANRILQIPTDTHAQKEDLIHMAISPEKGNYEGLGETREERYDAFMEIIREAGKVIEKEVNFVEVFWISGIHLNTDIPHAHLAICRDGLNSLTKRRGRINHLPRTLLPHHQKNDSGQKEFVPGKIAETVSRGIERQQELVRQKKESRERTDSRTDGPTHEQTTRQVQPPDDHDRQLTINQDTSRASNQELTQNVTNPDRISAQPDPTEPRITVEPPIAIESVELTNTINHTFEQPQHLDRENQTKLYLDHKPQDPSATLSNPSGAELHRSHEQSQPPDELQEPTDLPEPIWRDRYILGRSMVARGEVDRLQSELKSIREHGDKRRFRVYDETHGHTRQISEFDIRRRADASATAAVRQAQILDPERRQQLRQTRYDSEIERHAKGIGDHQIIVSKTRHKLEGQLVAAEKEHAEYRPHVVQIQVRYQAHPLPVPLLRQSELNKLQDQAIAARNPVRIQTLETIRESLAVERAEQTRTDQDIARLDGQLLVVRSEQAARQERAHQFERTCHQTRWDINDKKYSLVELDRSIKEQENRSRVFGTPLKLNTFHLRPSGRRDAAAKAQELKTIRQLVIEKIEDRRQDLATAVREAGRMTSVLSEIHLKEHDRLIQRNGERHEKLLTRSELAQLIDHANVLSDPAMLKHALMLETRYEEHQAEDKRPSLTATAARAIGRETLSEIALHQATRKLDVFKENKQFTAVSIKDLNGEEQTARLFDLRRPRHPLIWLGQRITESKENSHLRHETAKAIDIEHERLKEEVTRATQCHELTKGMADFHREQLRSLNQPVPEPAFNPKQVIQLELYAARHPDPLEQMRVQTLVHRADLAAYSRSKQTPKAPEAPLTNVTPAEPLHRTEQQRTIELTNPSNHQPNKNDSLHLAGPDHHSSQTQPPIADRQPTAPHPSVPEPSREAPNLEDLLH